MKWERPNDGQAIFAFALFRAGLAPGEIGPLLCLPRFDIEVVLSDPRRGYMVPRAFTPKFIREMTDNFLSRSPLSHLAHKQEQG